MLLKFFVEFHSILSPSCQRVISTFPEFRPLEPTDREAVEAVVLYFSPNGNAALL